MSRTCPILLWAAAALVATAACADDDIQSLIARLGADQPKPVRIAAAKTLGHSSEKSALLAVEALAAACADRDDGIREAAVISLGLLLSRHQQPCHVALVGAMLDSSPAVRENASGVVLLLAERMPPEAVPLLLKRADHRNPHVRSDVLTALAHGAGQDPAVRAVLRQAAHDRSLLVRINAVAGLWRATKDLSAVVPHWLELAESTNSPDANGEDSALCKLAGIGAAQQFHTLGRERPEDLIAVLVPFLADESPVARRAAARTLGALAEGSEDAKASLKKHRVRQMLAPLLDDPEESVRANAVIALHRLSE